MASAAPARSGRLARQALAELLTTDPLDDACCDHHVGLAMGEYIPIGQSVTTSGQGWSDGMAGTGSAGTGSVGA